MGLFDKILKNVAGDVLENTTRIAERNVATAITNKMTATAEKYSGVVKEKMKDKVDDKKAELRDKIIEESKKQKMPDIVPNGDNGTSETLKFAAHETVNYHYKNPEKHIDMNVPMIVVGGMTYKTENSGSHVGDDAFADILSRAVINAFQEALDKIVDEHIAPEDLYSKQAIKLSQLTKEGVENICTQYNIPDRTVLLSVVHYGSSYIPGTSTSANWTCPYCGQPATGNQCPSCGANRYS